MPSLAFFKYICMNPKFFTLVSAIQHLQLILRACLFHIYNNLCAEHLPTCNGINAQRSVFLSLWRETQVAAQLKKTYRMQKEFINIAAHELRTPIMPILCIADMIVSADTDSTEDLKVTREEINIIARNARRLQRLSSDMLDVTKIEGDSLKPNKSQFALNDLLPAASRTRRARARTAMSVSCWILAKTNTSTPTGSA
jgi:signal transduction histidine kinase